MIETTTKGTTVTTEVSDNVERTESRHTRPGRRRLPRRLLPVLILGGALLLLGIVFLIPGHADQLQPVEPPPVNVVTMEVRPVEAMQDLFSMPGIVRPWATVRLAAEVNGRVERLAAREGEAIAPGQPLVYLETALLKAAYDQAKAKADYDARDAERLAAAAERNVATPMEVDIARTAAAGSAAALEQAASKLQKAVIQAPSDFTPGGGANGSVGFLNDLLVDVGEYVTEGTDVAEIVDIDPVKVQVDIPERDVHYLSVGQKTTVRLEAPEELRFEGEIIFISSAADEKTRTFRTEIRVPNPDHRLRGQMIVKVELLRQVLPQAVMIPLDSIIPLEHGYEVYVNDNGVARRRTVKLGLIKGQLVQALEPQPGDPSYRPEYPGLKVGERLIIKGDRLVGDGQKVAERNDVLLGAAASARSPQ